MSFIEFDLIGVFRHLGLGTSKGLRVVVKASSGFHFVVRDEGRYQLPKTPRVERMAARGGEHLRLRPPLGAREAKILLHLCWDVKKMSDPNVRRDSRWEP